MEIVQCSRVEGIHYKLVPGQTRYAVGYTDYEDFMSMPDWLDQGGYQGSEIRFLDLTDNTIWVPFTKRENVLYGNTLLWEDKLWFLRGDFNIGQMTLIAFRPGEKPEEIHSIPVSEVNLYNLQLLPHPVHIVSQSNELRVQRLDGGRGGRRPADEILPLLRDYRGKRPHGQGAVPSDGGPEPVS